MPRDMRSWIGELEAAGELLHIRKSVDPKTQMGALLYQSRERALLFRRLATLRTDAPVFDDLDELRWRGPPAAFERTVKRLLGGVIDYARRVTVCVASRSPCVPSGC